MRGRLNSFQKTMLQWNDAHPYNAAHVVRLPIAPDAETLDRAVRQILEAHGVTGLSIDRNRGRYEYAGGRATSEVRWIQAGELHNEVERELNTRFAWEEPFDPFRFFAVPDGNGLFLGVTYFHPIADAEPVVRLLRDVVEACRPGKSARVQPFDLYPPFRDSVLGRPSLLLRKLGSFSGQVRNLQTSARARFVDINDQQVAFRFLALDSATLERMIKTSKAWKVTVNDLLLALMLKGFRSLASRRAGRKRHKLTVGCIVNTRKDLGVGDERAFGLFLGSFTVTHAVPDGITLRELASDVRRETATIKERRLYLAAPLEMGLGRVMLGLFSTDRRKKLYQKHYPLWGGITNMKLDSIWEPRPDEPPIDYFRAVSTGPVTPLVLSVTTVGERVNMGLTCRRTVFSPAQVESFQAGLLAELSQLSPE